MKATRADTRAAVMQAAALHAVLFVLMFAGLQWTRHDASEPAAGEVIEADLVDPAALSAPMRRALTRAPRDNPPPAPVPVPEETPLPPSPLPAPVDDALPPPVPEPAPVEQEAVQRDAPSQEVAKVPREQEARRRAPEQVDLDARKASEDERLRQQRIADLKRQREQAAKERTQAEMRAQQLADATGAAPAERSPPPGQRGRDASLLAQYAAAIQQAIVRQWTRPESVQLGQRCRIAIRQLPGGEVVDVSIGGSCPFDEQGRQSVERAILKASPLPYAGFEDVFDRNLTLNFVAEER